MNTTTPQDMIMWVVCVLLAFFIGRVILLWYYKIDLRLQEQQETNKLLRELIALQKKPSVSYTDDTPAVYNTANETDLNEPGKLEEAIKKYNNK